MKVTLKKSGMEAILHPAIDVISHVERLWSADDKQAGYRAGIVVRALAEAGLFPDCSVIDGVPCLAETSGD